MAREQVNSILRALRILECFSDSSKEWTLKTLVAELELPTTTVFRQLSTLVEKQYLVQDPIRKNYQVGPMLLVLAGSILGQSDLRQAARPELERLSEIVQETVNLCILVEHDIFYLDKVETHRSIACNTKIGGRAPAYATSSGKIILANCEEAAIEEYCAWMQTAKPLTPATITDPNQLKAELALAKTNGYAVDNGEIESGLICLGAPVYDLSGHVIAAVSVAGPDYRMRQEQERIVEETKKTAKQISYLLGYR